MFSLKKKSERINSHVHPFSFSFQLTHVLIQKGAKVKKNLHLVEEVSSPMSAVERLSERTQANMMSECVSEMTTH